MNKPTFILQKNPVKLLLLVLLQTENIVQSPLLGTAGR